MARNTEHAIKKQLWLCLLAANLLGLIVFGIHWYVSLRNASVPVPVSAFVNSAVLLFITGSLASAPLIRFVVLEWGTRYDEFVNRLNNDALTSYLQQFWEKRAIKAPNFIAWTRAECEDKTVTQKQIDHSMENIFDAIYHDQYGRSAFFVPLALLFFTIFISTVLCILVYLEQIKIVLDDFDATVIAIASMAGAYMYIVSDSIQSVRQRSLNSSTLYWYALRMLLAIPIGVALTSLIAEDAQPFVAFGIGALPMDQLIKGLRRLSTEKLNLTVKEEEADQLIRLEGVTGRIASLLIAEGVDSIGQIITVDPVLLSIRTGLPFKFILYLGSQAIVRRYLGEAAEQLIPLGLADARSIAALVRDLDKLDDALATERAEAILKVATSLIMPTTNSYTPECLEFNFRQIDNSNYTKFIEGKLLTMN